MTFCVHKYLPRDVIEPALACDKTEGVGVCGLGGRSMSSQSDCTLLCSVGDLVSRISRHKSLTSSITYRHASQHRDIIAGAYLMK